MNFDQLISDLNTIIVFIVALGTTFLFTALGSFVSEIYMMSIAKSRRISISRFFISTICSGFIALILGEYIGNNISIILYFSGCFILGLVGYEITLKIANLDFWLEVYDKIRKKK